MSGIAGDPGDREPPEHFADEEKAMTENDEGAVRRIDAALAVGVGEGAIAEEAKRANVNKGRTE